MDHTTQPIKVYRGDYIESTHNIHIAVVKSNGELLAYYGDPHRLTFARSSMKPLQAIPAVESGAVDNYAIHPKELSLFCASHSGEPFHRETVMQVLQKLNLSEKQLQCGTHVPRHMESYNELIRGGGELTPVFSNCSGKHSGMLAGTVAQGMDVKTYRQLSHPYQQQILDVIADVTSYDRESIATSVDGCGVPVHRVPLYNLALSFSRLAKPDDWTGSDEKRKEALRRICHAMVTHPEMVAGTKEFDTDLMKVFDGRIVAKGGAEGVHCFGDTETGIGVAIKIEDGNSRARSVVTMEVLRQLTMGKEGLWNELSDYIETPVLNARNEKIGKVVANFTLQML